jgi:glucokinase
MSAGRFTAVPRRTALKIDSDSWVIAGDIGGTKTTLGLFSPGGRRPVAQATRTFESASEPGLEKLLEMFIAEHPVPVRAACIGVAGPVVNGRVKTTNLRWEVSEEGISRLFGWRKVKLVNDLAATAMAVPLLSSRELHRLNTARAAPGAPVAVIAPGTGLGMAFLVPCGEEMLPVSSEGGHTDFSPVIDGDFSLWRELKAGFGHVSVERVVSGPGLTGIYRWLRKESGVLEPEWLRLKLSSEDPARVVSEAGIDGRDEICTKAVRHFVRILGSVCGNAALMLVARGGVYLGGGIPPKILSFLDQGGFMDNFCDKGRFSDLMKRIPVRVILNPQAALLGAARMGFRMAGTDK